MLLRKASDTKQLSLSTSALRFVSSLSTLDHQFIMRPSSLNRGPWYFRPQKKDSLQIRTGSHLNVPLHLLFTLNAFQLRPKDRVHPWRCGNLSRTRSISVIGSKRIDCGSHCSSKVNGRVPSCLLGPAMLYFSLKHQGVVTGGLCQKSLKQTTKIWATSPTIVNY